METDRLAASIRNAAYLVRLYGRPHQREMKRHAIEALGRAIAQAFSSSANFEPLLKAIIEGLTDERERRPLI